MQRHSLHEPSLSPSHQRRDDDFIAIPCDQDYVEDWLTFIVDFSKGSKSLVILDDCASGKNVKNRTSELVKLGFSERHNLSVVAISHIL